MTKHPPNSSRDMGLKKVLIVTYYWPPAGGPGVQRWLKFVKYLPKFGVSPVVCIPENPSYPIIDESLHSEALGVTVIKSPISEPSNWASLLFKKRTASLQKGIINEKNPSFIEKCLRAVRGNFFIPDARVSWVKPTTELLKKHLKNEQIDTIITTGPPHSVHLIGKRLQKDLGIRWIADFRDPWTNIGYHSALYMSYWAKKRHKLLESSVLQSADQILVTSPQTAQEFSLLTKQPIEVITNGFEPFNEPAKVSKTMSKAMEGFSVLHIGSLLSKRNPQVLWEVFSELVQESKAFKDVFSLHFVGVVSEQVKESLRLFGLESMAFFHGYLPHDTARSCQQLGKLLLLLEVNSEQHRGIIPGKLFEYMASEKPILALGPRSWAVEHIIQQTQSGAVFNEENKAALKEYIYLIFLDFEAKKKSFNPIGIAAYHRESLSSKLADIIHGTGH